MSTLEITTTQNVVIQMQPASLLDRIVAFVIDVIVLFLIFQFTVLGFLEAIVGDNEWILQLIAIILSFYSLLFERFNKGRTPGKALLNLKVVREDGSLPDGVDLFKRWSLRFLDIWLSLGSIATISIGSSVKSQRLGDKIAGTIVIKQIKDSKYKLKDLLKIESSDDYSATYPEVTQMGENHMITLKRLLNRSAQYRSLSVYKELLNEAADRMEQELKVARKEKTAEEFIKQLLRDYVILTR